MNLPWYMSKYEKQIPENMKNIRANWEYTSHYAYTSVLVKFDFFLPETGTFISIYFYKNRQTSIGF